MSSQEMAIEGVISSEYFQELFQIDNPDLMDLYDNTVNNPDCLMRAVLELFLVGRWDLVVRLCSGWNALPSPVLTSAIQFGWSKIARLNRFVVVLFFSKIEDNKSSRIADT